MARSTRYSSALAIPLPGPALPLLDLSHGLLTEPACPVCLAANAAAGRGTVRTDPRFRRGLAAPVPGAPPCMRRADGPTGARQAS
jgi:hypothetical protein